MKITYISHATLLIETGGKKIVTDPWVKGSTYCNQWHLFPKAVSPEKIIDADYVVYSHGHEDHLHANSLKTINKEASVFYPYSWYGGTTEFFSSMGFKNVKEVLNERTVTLGKIRITYLSNNLDNVVVIEDGEEVLVNINDALPSASPLMITHFINKINKRWKKIDYVFSSYGGASYFPNTVHYSEKNDVEIAEARELFFITNFCRIVSELNPRFAIPFATDFILLDENQRWINQTKFPRSSLRKFYEHHTKGKSKVQVLEAYPDDVVNNGGLVANSPYHKKIQNTPLLDTIDTDYKDEIERKRNDPKLPSNEIQKLLEKTEKHILDKQYIIPERIRKNIKFAIKIRDGEGKNILTINFRGSEPVFTISSEADTDLDLLIDLKSKTLKYTLNNEWGGDAIIIGYGAEIYIYNEAGITQEYENYCVRLLTRYPNTKEYLKKTPYRALKYLMSDETKRKNLIRRAMGNSGAVMDYTDPLLSKRDLWLNKSKCEVCKACNI